MANILGSTASERLVGTIGDDAITGGGGSDRFDGGAGNDQLTGGDDPDQLYGESGDDVLNGGGGRDFLYDGAGNDLVHGGEGNDAVDSQVAGSDQLFGEAGDDDFIVSRHRAGDTIDAFGGTGEDWLHVNPLAAGNVVNFDGGEGDDLLWFSTLGGTINATFGAGRDILDASSSFSSLGGTGGKLVINDWDGSAVGDVLDLSQLLGNVSTWSRNDNPFTSGYLRLVQSGGDVVLGYATTAFGTFKDIIQFKNVALAAFSAETFAGYSWNGSVGPAQSITGADEGALLTGGSGDDIVQGGAGFDTLWGGLGADTLRGGGSTDYLYGGAGNDLLEGEGDNDYLAGGGGDDVLHGGAGRDVVDDVGGGADLLYGDDGDDSITVNRSTKDAAAAIGAFGGEGNDRFTVIIGNASSVSLDGGAGDDTFTLSSVALGASATLTLGAGVDQVVFASSATSLKGIVTIVDFQTGDGGDRLDFVALLGNSAGWDKVSNPFTSGAARLVQSGSDTLVQYKATTGYVTLATLTGISSATLTAFNLGGYSQYGGVPASLTLTGTFADETMRGGEGADSLFGSDGADIVYGYNGNDVIGGGEGNDNLQGGLGDDQIDGGNGNDTISGGSGDDLINGGAGIDSLNANDGADRVYGGADNDAITDNGTGSHLLHGDDGDDTISVSRSISSGEQVSVYGDAGNDRITLNVFTSPGQLIVDGGAGDDRVVFTGLGTTTITLGAGADVIEFGSWLPSGAPVTVTDFQVGAGGDSLDLDQWLARFPAIDPNLNPFTTDVLRFVQSGADTILQFDQDGAGATYQWINLLTLKNVDMTTLRAPNMDNYQLLFQDGTDAGETLDGTAGDDVINAFGGDDIVHGFAGADKLSGGDGNDVIDGAAGADTINGDVGDDLLSGGADSDTISGGDGDDQIDGGSERDILHGDAGNDLIVGSDGDDDLFGDAGNDVLKGGFGSDALIGDLGDDNMDGGDGNDLLYSDVFDGTAQHDIVAGGLGTDVLQVDFFDVIGTAQGVTMTISADAAGGYAGLISAGADYSIAFSTVEVFGISGTNQADQITTGDGADLLIGQGGDDVLSAGAGNDILVGGAGADTMTGGTGNDSYDADDAADVLVENAGEGTDLVQVRLASYTLLDNFENLTGLLNTGQQLTGNSVANVIKGGTGNDVIDGGAGSDTLQGGLGNDIYYVDNAGDAVADTGGIDEIRTGLASYTIGASSGVENLTGTAATGQSLTGTSGANVLRGGAGSDSLFGLVGNDTLFGGDGDDSLDGGTGSDVMTGGRGDDTYYADSAADSVVELAGEGFDKVFTTATSYTLALNVENLTGTAAVGQTLRGNALDNAITGGNADDILRLDDGGADLGSGNGGNDILYFGATFDAADRANGGSGNDTLILQGVYQAGLTFGAASLVSIETLQLLGRSNTTYRSPTATANIYNLVMDDANVAAAGLLTVDASGLSAVETLTFKGSTELDGRFSVTGGAGADILDGGAGADVLAGGGGSDYLDGGLGADAMSGGSGDDIYIVDNAGDTVFEGGSLGTDEVWTDLASYVLTTANIEVLRGTSLTGQSLTGGAAGVTILGGSGNDIIDDGGGAETLKGGLGNDIYAVRSAGTVIAELAGQGSDTVRSYLASYTLGTELENLTGMLSTGQNLVGNAAANVIVGNSGGDFLDGRAGADDMTGGLGDDIYVVDDAGDAVHENAGGGTDTVQTSLASYVLGASANIEKLIGTSATGQALTGGQAGLIILAGAGNDTLDDGGAAEILRGGLGDDLYVVRSAGTAIEESAGAGSDTVRSYAASTTLGAELETLVGMLTTGQALTGNAGANTILGNAGADLLDGGAGADDMTGGLGDDIYVVDNAGDAVHENAGEGTDTVRTSLAAYTLAATLEKLTGIAATGQALTGNSSDNVITGGAGDDVLVGGAGSDQLVGGAGSDTIDYALGGAIEATVSAAGTGQIKVGAGETDAFSGIEKIVGSASADVFTSNVASTMILAGGGGNDTYYLLAGTESVQESANGGIDKIVTNAAAYTLGANLENLTGLLSTGQNLRGNSGDNEILGAAGDDTIRLGDGGRDHASGGEGNDNLYFGGTFDNLDLAEGGAGYDLLLLQGNYANLVVGANLAGVDAVELLSRSDARFGGSGTTPTSYVITSSGVQTTGQYYFFDARGLMSDETLSLDATGETGAGFWVEGGAGADTLKGGALGDHLNGGAGADYMAGGAGSDVYYVDNAGDQVVEAADAGSDIVRTTLAAYTLTANIEGLVGDLNTGQQLTGNALDNVFEAGDGDDVIDGGAGNDNMIGRGGDDVYIVDSLGDGVFENAGQGTDEIRTALAGYTIAANVETLTGTAGGAQTLRGNSGDNILAKDSGVGTFLLQDGGADRASGSNSNDVFYFGAAFGAGDQVDGGFGADEAVLQGAYGTITLAAGAFTNVETLSLLSAGDNRFGAAAAGTFSYDVAIAAGFSMPPQFPFHGESGGFTIDASSLAAGETLHFDASASDAGLQLSVIGGAGADTLIGGAGSEDLTGGAGDDLLEGGAGGDYLYEDRGGSDTLRGGDGDDVIAFTSGYLIANATPHIEGGAGNDDIRFWGQSGASATIEAGSGDDVVEVSNVDGGPVQVTLGSGRDSFKVGGAIYSLRAESRGDIHIADFATGATGDRFVWADLSNAFYGYEAGTNPFATGFARLVQSGADTLLQISFSANGNFETLVRFENHLASDFTGDNFSGWSPFAITGAAGNDDLFGTSSGDWVYGDAGNDFFHLQQGGDDFASGGIGNDAFYFGAAFTAGDEVDGGTGKDVIALQGDYSGGLTFGAASLTSVETLTLLSHTDDRFGGGSATGFSYVLTPLDGNVAAGQQLIVNASTLEAGENLTFNGAAETDGTFFIYGGKGVDTLTGGSKADVFFFAEDGRFAASDHADGGAGADVLVLRGDYSLVLTGSSITNIETVTLMSGADSRFYATTTKFSYDITTAENTVAPGATMTFNGGGLSVGEMLKFDGSAETDGGAYRVFGGSDADTITGGSGNDLIYGGLGSDVLKGGAGSDVFRYQSVSESTASASDKILDFAGGDRIDVSRAGHFDFIGSNAFSGHAGELRVDHVGSAWAVSADLDGDGNADLVIAITVTDNHDLTTSDFIF